MLHEHNARAHGNVKKVVKPAQFKMQVTGSYGTNITRQISEGLLIDKEVQLREVASRKQEEVPGRKMEVLNSASQWLRPGLVKVCRGQPHSIGLVPQTIQNDV